MEEKYIKVSEKYLEEAIKFAGSSLVGKIMKRFEIMEDINSIKSESKELIYEEMRNLKNILIAYNTGREVTVFKFVSKPEPK